MTPCIEFENSDYSLVVFYCKTNNLKRGRGFLKLNKSLLTDTDYVGKVKKPIDYVKIQNSGQVYNAENLLNI